MKWSLLRRRAYVFVAAFTALAIAMAVWLVSWPAAADESHTRSYTLTDEFHSTELGRCLRTTLAGEISFTLTQRQRLGWSTATYTDIKVQPFAMEAASFTTCNGGEVASLSGAGLHQSWAADASAERTPRCDSEEEDAGFWDDDEDHCPDSHVTRTTLHQVASTTYSQHNSGNPITVSGDVRAGRASSLEPLCLPVTTRQIAYLGGDQQDEWVRTFDVCVTV